MRSQSSRSHRNPFQTVLAVGLPEADGFALHEILANMHWEVKRAAHLATGFRQLTSRSWPVVVCESNVAGGGWKMLLEKTGVLSHPPALVVSSRLADDWLWAEVLNLGGYDVLATPFEAGEVRHVLSHAADSWRRRIEAASASPKTRTAASITAAK